MIGDVTYGKPVDIWAVGLIMFELISGKHLLWQGKEDKNTYKERVKSLKQLDLSGHSFSE